MAIGFYSTRGTFGGFSNFSRHPVKIDGVCYPTTEHYFQAQKFAHSKEHFQLVVNAATPSEAARLGRMRTFPMRSDWDDVRDDIMRHAVRAKMAAHPSLASVLLSTGDQELYEDSPVDAYWGIGKNGDGKNMLGKILMEVRAEMKKPVAQKGPMDAFVSKKMPHSRCNWLVQGKIMVGADPTPETFPAIIDAGITRFYAFIEPWYVDSLPTNVGVTSVPVKSGAGLGKKRLSALADEIIATVNDGGVVYLHCSGGHGRAGMVAAAVIGKYKGMDVSEAVAFVEKARETREDKSRNFVPTPETNAQIRAVEAVLGLTGALPDRSDTSWLKRVRVERDAR